MITFVIITWVSVGLYFGRVYTFDLIWLIQSSISLRNYNQEVKNRAFQGNVYDSYAELKKTPISTKILYLIPDIHHLPRAIFYLYPRTIIAASSPVQALAELRQQRFDYVLIYVINDADSSYSPTSAFQQYWVPEELSLFVAEITRNKPMPNDELFNYLSVSNGAILLQTYVK